MRIQTPLVVVALILFPLFYTHAQVGIGTTTPNSKAVLELKSPGNNQGFLVPRLTTSERTSIAGLSATDNGLLVYDSQLNKFFFWQNSGWIQVDEPQDLNLAGSTLTITNHPAATPVNLSAFTGTNTDDQTLSYNPSTGLLTITRLSGSQSQTITTAGAASGDLTGTYPNPTITNNAVTSVKILDGTVSSVDITDATIATADLGDGSVTSTKVLDGAIVAADLGNNAVTSAKLQSDAAVDANRAVTTNHIQDNAVTTTKISNGAITAAKLSTTGVGAGSYGTGTQVPQIIIDAQGRITSAANVAVTGAAPIGAASGHLSGSYPNPTIAPGAGSNIVTAVNDGATTGTINTNRLNTSVVLDSESPGAGDVSGSFTSGLQIVANSVTTAEIADATIITTDLANSSVTAAKLATTSVVANSYGSSTQVSTFTVDAQGRLTAAANATISGVSPGGAASGDLAGTYPAPTISTSAATGNTLITSVNNATVGTVNTSRLNAAVVLDSESPAVGDVSGTFTGGLQINASAVTSAEISDGTVSSTDITDATIATADLADGSVTSVKVADGTISSADIANLTIATADVADGAVTDAKIATGITFSKLTSSATNGQVLTTVGGATAWASLPAFGTVTSIATGTGLTGGPITGTGTIGIASNGVTSTELRSDAATDVNRAVTTNHIRDNAITTGKITDATILAADLASSSVTDVKIASGITVSKLTASSTAGQVLTTVGTTASWAVLPDASATNEIQNLSSTISGTQRTINISGGTGTTIDVADNDNSTTNELQDLADVLNQGNDAKTLAAVNFSAISINMTTTPGALNVDGAHFRSFTSLPTGSETYDVKPEDYIIIGRSTTSKPYNVILPKAPDNRGRILIIRATGTGASDGIRVVSSESIDGSASLPIMYIEGGSVVYSVTVMSDGKDWYTISKSR